MASPLLGYNNNVRHRGQIFHIQTEDSGIRHPHVITHLFADGGRILKTLKTSYAEHLESDKLHEIVRGLMKQQHKAMFVALREGRFDDLLELPPATEAAQETKAVSQAPPSESSPALRTPQRAQAPDLFTEPPSETSLDIEALERVAMSAQPQDGAATGEQGPERTPSGRYVQTRPASIFSTSQSSGSLFGGELVSERSLDEVILSYLAEDLGEAENESS